MAHLPCLHSHFLGDTGFAASSSTVPAFYRRRAVCPTECKESRIGKAPVAIPKGVEVIRDGLHFTVKVLFPVL